MPDRSGIRLEQINGRSIVQLRVRPQAADAAGKVLQLPRQALQWQGGDPASYWLGPDLWLFTSDTQSAGDMIAYIDHNLADQLHAAKDMSSAYVCFALGGAGARTVLSMGCGIDLHPRAFKPGQCVRTHFAKLLLFIVAVQDSHFELYVDRSYTRYLSEWLAKAGEDPILYPSIKQGLCNSPAVVNP